MLPAGRKCEVFTVKGMPRRAKGKFPDVFPESSKNAEDGIRHRMHRTSVSDLPTELT